MSSRLTENTFREEGKIIMGDKRRANQIPMRKYKSWFGTSPAVCIDLWEMINPKESISKLAIPAYLLWALMLLKIYSPEDVLASMAGAGSEKTFRRWAWRFIEKMEELSYTLVRLQSILLLFNICWCVLLRVCFACFRSIWVTDFRTMWGT